MQKNFNKLFILSPLNRRRLKIFRQHKRGYYSLIIFSFFFFLSLFSEIIANDNPLLIYNNGNFYFPIFEELSEQELGGSFPTKADFSDPFLLEILAENEAIIIWPLIRYSYDSHANVGVAPSAPTLNNWLGTDDQARDVGARILYGFRISIIFGLSLTIVSSIIGIMVGLSQGYFGGKFDLFGQRFIEIWSALPGLYILIILSSLIEPSLIWLLFIMILFSWAALVGVVRAEVLRVRNLDYVRAARALGLSDARIMLRHILPNALTAAITFLPFIAVASLVTLTQLDFLGFGLPPGSPSLGELLLQAKNNVQSPWLGFSAFFAIGVLLTLLIFTGEALRDAFDPRINK